MYASCPQWLLGTVLLLCATLSASEESLPRVLPPFLADVANIDQVTNVDDILNLGDLRTKKIFYTRDCEELYQLGHTESGLYVIRPEGSSKLVVQCFFHECDGWTVVQKNSFNTEIDWSVSWTTYKYGFGFIEKDHFLGNYYIHLMTKQKWYRVRIILRDSAGNYRFAEYDSFRLDDADQGYRLRLGAYHGDAGDSLTNTTTRNMHDNMKFSTHDQDNDLSRPTECADLHGGGWWYDSCYDSQLNRQNGIHWHTLCDHNCMSSLILIKPIYMLCDKP